MLLALVVSNPLFWKNPIVASISAAGKLTALTK
jgi:hypothetical protein